MMILFIFWINVIEWTKRFFAQTILYAYTFTHLQEKKDEAQITEKGERKQHEYKV